jgi:Tc5 transposase DNA-binding domain
MPLRVVIVRQMAGILATQRAGSATIKPIGEKWVYNFIKRHNDL